MKLQWSIGKEDVAKVRAIVEAQAENSLYRKRARRLVTPVKKVTKARFWRAMVCMRLTSQQKSGPGSHVARFIALNDFPLNYAATREVSRVDRFITRTLRSAGGIRFCDRIGRDLSYNFACLEGGQWRTAIARCNGLAENPGREREIEVADFVDDEFKGFGPKQARNLLQALGLTRYEIPIDSRMIRWLNRNGFPLQLSAGALGDKNYYRFVSEGIQELCEKADVLPCLFDAAIFTFGYPAQFTEEQLDWV